MTTDSIKHDHLHDELSAVESDTTQFTLRDLFAVTTGVAAACGLAVWQGAATLTYSIGMLLSLINVTGRLAVFQSNATRPSCFYIAWALLLASLLLPSVPGCGSSVIPGWEVGLLTAQFEAGLFMAMFDQDRKEAFSEAVVSLAIVTIINLANLLMILSPWLLYKLQRQQGHWMGNVLAVCALHVWVIGWTGDYLVGYYVWCASFALILITHRIRWPMFGVMVAYLPIVWVLAFACGDPGVFAGGATQTAPVQLEDLPAGE